MVTVLIQMGLLIGCGVLWRWLRPGGVSADALRLALTSSVYYLFLPAMVLSVLGRTDMGRESIGIALFGVGIILFGMIVALLLCRWHGISPARFGAAVLATAFANVTFLGLPLLEHTFGNWARAIVLQIDFFAFSPVLYTLGASLARRYGHDENRNAGRKKSGWFNPPLLAAFFAVLLDVLGLSIPDWLQPSLDVLAQAVIPLMLVSLGLGLRWEFHGSGYLSTTLAVLGAKLLIIPLFGVWLGWQLGFSGDRLTALVLESAMPCMAMGLVFCDRYRLDTSFYALVTTLSTALAAFTLPLWHYWGNAGFAVLNLSELAVSLGVR